MLYYENWFYEYFYDRLFRSTNWIIPFSIFSTYICIYSKKIHKYFKDSHIAMTASLKWGQLTNDFVPMGTKLVMNMNYDILSIMMMALHE